MAAPSNRITQTASGANPLSDGRFWSRWIAWLFDLPPLWEYNAGQERTDTARSSAVPWVRLREAFAHHLPRLESHLRHASVAEHHRESWFVEFTRTEQWSREKLAAAVGWLERVVFPDVLELARVCNLIAATSPRLQLNAKAPAPGVPATSTASGSAHALAAATDLKSIGAILINAAQTYRQRLDRLVTDPLDTDAFLDVIVTGRQELGVLLAGLQQAIRRGHREAAALETPAQPPSHAAVAIPVAATPPTSVAWSGRRTWFARVVDGVDTVEREIPRTIITEEVDVPGGKIQVAGSASGSAIEAGQISQAVQEIARQTRETTHRLHRETLLHPPAPGPRQVAASPRPAPDPANGADENDATITRTRLRITHSLPRDVVSSPQAPPPPPRTGNVEINADLRLDSPNAQRMALALEKIQSRAPVSDGTDFADTLMDASLPPDHREVPTADLDAPPPPAGPGPTARRGIDPAPPPARGPKPLVVNDSWGKPITYSDTQQLLPPRMPSEGSPTQAAPPPPAIRDDTPPPPPAGPGRLTGNGG